MTVEQLGAIAGVILSLAFSYIPGLRDKYSVLDATKKSLVMLGLLLVAAVAALALSCAQIVNAVECSQSGATNLLITFFYAAVANQTTYRLSPQVSKPASS